MATMPMNRRQAALALALAGPFAPAFAADAPGRQALVIGNSGYSQVPLKNPGSDARAVHALLQSLGFTSELLLEAGWRRQIEAARRFVTGSAEAPARVVFYAGHGAQVRGRNYLIPVDAPMDNTDAMVACSLDAGELLDAMSRSPGGLNLLILDACRNNPANQFQMLADGRRIKVRASASGLAPLRAPVGSVVAFATSPGNVAEDTGAENSVYTRCLLRHLATPGIPLETMFKRVRIDVLGESQQRQRPWEASSLVADYCLASGGACPGR